METDAPDRAVDQVYLTGLVQKALARPALKVTDWKVQPLHGGLEWNSAVYRFQGNAKEVGETIPWSFILKTIKPTPHLSEPGGIWYWKREALAYQSGLLHNLPGGNISAPACHIVEERPDGSLWLWLEDIQDDVSSPWPLEQYAITARHLGQFNGAYLTGKSLPCEPWITRNWLRMYVEHAAGMVEFMRRNLHHPVVRHMFPGDSAAQVLAVWDERKAILDVLENLPQVLCHQDAFRRNLFARQGKTIAIDWGYMGIAPIGAELVALVAASIGFFEIPSERVRDLDCLCFDGYLQGLRDSGWKGDSRLVRTGYAVSLMLRYPIGGQVGEMLPKLMEQEGRSRLEKAFEDKPADLLEQSDPALVAYYQGVLPEALKLLGIRQLTKILIRIAGYTFRLRMNKGK